MKIRPVKAEMFHAHGQTDRRMDMTKLIVAYRNFANAPKTGVSIISCITIEHNNVLLIF